MATNALAGNKTNTGLRLVRYFESLGATVTTGSCREVVALDASVLADKVEPLFKGLFATIATAPHEPYVYEEGRPAVELAYDLYSQNTQAKLKDLIEEAAFGEATPYGNSIYATSADAVSVADVLQYRAANFVKQNLVVTATGLSADALAKLVEVNAADVPSGKAVTLPGSAYVGGEVRVKADLNGKVNVALAFPAPVGSAAKPYEVLSAVLGAKLAEKGVPATPFVVAHAKAGLFGVNFATTPEQVEIILKSVLTEVKAISNAAPEVEAAKSKVTIGKLVGLEGKAATSQLLMGALYGESALTLADVRAVTGANVQAAAASVIKSTPSYAVLGTTAGTPSYSTVLSLVA